MALFDSVLYRITGITNCVVYFEDTIECKSESVAVPDGQIYYVSHCTGDSVSINVFSGLYELITTTPVTYQFSACSSNSAFTETVSIYGYDGQFDLTIPNITYYFSAITSNANPSSYYPCQFEGCWELISSGGSNTNYFYSSYWYDPVSAGTCGDCGTTYHSGDPIFDVNSGCCFDSFCLYTEYGPFSGYDGNYVSAGTYDGYSYFTGGSNPGFIYYSTGNTSWCLSTSLGGGCDLFGAKPCYSQCPDICDEVFGGNICPTPTPSPTVNCSLNDFTALFDCDVIPTPTPTPTVTSSPTSTPTPTPTINPCNFADVQFTVNSFTPTPTPTPSQTPAAYVPPFDCFISGSAIFNTFEGNMICGNQVSVWVDCGDGSLYYTTQVPFSGGPYVTGDTFFAYIGGSATCVRFSGVTDGSVNTFIELKQYAGVDCTFCSAVVPSPTPTPSSTLTPTPTPTQTMTPTPSGTPDPIFMNYYIYRLCEKYAAGYQLIIQETPYPAAIGELISFGVNQGTNTYSNPKLPISWQNWEYMEVFNGTSPQLLAYINVVYVINNIPPVYTIFATNYLGDKGLNLISNAVCDNGNAIDAEYPIYVFTNCGSLTNILYQYGPVSINNTPLNPGDVVKYNTGGSVICWVYNGQITGVLNPSTNQPLSFTAPVGLIVEVHSNANYFWDDTILGITTCTDCNP